MTNPGPQTNHPNIASDSNDIPGRMDFGSICAAFSCAVVHPAEDHDTYLARYLHSANCQVCAEVDKHFHLAPAYRFPDHVNYSSGRYQW